MFTILFCRVRYPQNYKIVIFIRAVYTRNTNDYDYHSASRGKNASNLWNENRVDLLTLHMCCWFC